MAARHDLANRLESDLAGPLALPRSNGELVFKEPWEGRAFGTAVALCESGLYTWDEFRHYLIAEVARWDSTHAPTEHYDYYQRWLAALERLLTEKGLVAAEELAARITRQAHQDSHR